MGYYIYSRKTKETIFKQNYIEAVNLYWEIVQDKIQYNEDNEEKRIHLVSHIDEFLKILKILKESKIEEVTKNNIAQQIIPFYVASVQMLQLCEVQPEEHTDFLTLNDIKEILGSTERVTHYMYSMIEKETFNLYEEQ